MEPKRRVASRCKQDGSTTVYEQEEGHISRTATNVDDCVHLDSSDLNLENSADEKSGQHRLLRFGLPGDCRHSEQLDLLFQNSADRKDERIPVTSSGLPQAPEFPVSRDLFSPQTEPSSFINENLLYEKQSFSKTERAIDTNTTNGDLGQCVAAAPCCKNSKFYVDSSDEDSSTSGEHNEHFARLSEEHKLYLQRMSNTGFLRKHRDLNEQYDPQHLFDCLLLIGLTVGSTAAKVPYTLIKFPPDASVPPYTEHLCFPDAHKWTPSSEQNYSFVLTRETGQRKYGYCRRVLPEGSSVCLPLVYCIVTPFRARGFYHNILEEIESHHGQSANLFSAFITSLYNSRIPEPGQTLRMVARNSSAEESYGEMPPILRRPHDTRLEEQDLVEMFDILDIPIFLKVFGSVLLERKIILISKSFIKLSSCAEAIQSVLYPFSWQHALISVLPHSLMDVCQSPTPYIVGILDNGDNHVLDLMHTFSEGIIVNLDESNVLCKVGDESSILPSVPLKHLRASLELVSSTRGTAEPSTRNVLISEAFLRMFTDLCGHYRHHILSLNDELVFDHESFIKSASSNSICLFLQWFVETAMFTAFIASRLEKVHEEDRFDQRAYERAEEQRKQNKGGKRKTKTLKESFKSWRTGSR